MEKVWLSEYPKGVPAEVDLHAFASLEALWAHMAARFGALPAYSNMGVALSFADVDRLSRDFAAFLQGACGMKKGDRIALMMPNLLQYPVALFGALRAGLVVVNVNPLYTERELEHQLRDSGAIAIVVLANFAGTLARVRDKTAVRTVIISQVGDLLPALKRTLVNFAVKYVKHMVPAFDIPGAVSLRAGLRAGAGHALEPVALGHDDIAFLQYTGGTTGVAKGAVLTHGNIVANVLQVGAWVSANLAEGKETMVIPLPLYHIYALTSCLVFGKFGAHCVLITNPRELPAFIDTLKKVRATGMIAVNTLYGALVRDPRFAEVDMSRLKLASAGGMAIQRAVAEAFKKRVGVPLVEGYGMTETSPVVISNRLDIDDWTGFIGLPIPSTEATILDDAGRPLGPGEVGEICVRGPQLMRGYWNRDDETRKALTKDGWFRTGDMGLMDARGYFKITDRKKDMIIVSGFNVFPNEVEDVVMLHPSVLEVGAVGLPDERSGERVKVVVVRKDDTLTAEALIEHCKQHLAGYKVPKVVEFREEPLPKTAIGKILRRQLRTEEPRPPAEAP